MISSLMRGWRVLLCRGALLAAVGCGADDGLNRRAVSGLITLDGVPLEAGVISLDPAEDFGGTLPAGAVVTDGSYSIPAESGPTPGKYRVSIRSASPGAAAASDEAPGDLPLPSRKKKAVVADEEPIPAIYNDQSTLVVEIPASGSESVDFELKSD